MAITPAPPRSERSPLAKRAHRVAEIFDYFAWITVAVFGLMGLLFVMVGLFGHSGGFAWGMLVAIIAAGSIQWAVLALAGLVARYIEVKS